MLWSHTHELCSMGDLQRSQPVRNRHNFWSWGIFGHGDFSLSRIKLCSSAWSNSWWNIDHCLGKRELGPSTRVGWIFYVVRMFRCTQENVHLVEGKSSCSQNLEISYQLPVVVGNSQRDL